MQLSKHQLDAIAAFNLVMVALRVLRYVRASSKDRRRRWF
jgi:hypothetical protein